MTGLSLLLVAFMSDGAMPSANAAMDCTFAAPAMPEFRVSVEPVERPYAAPGMFHIRMMLADEIVAGNAVALPKTEARDVVMRGITADRTTYLIALRDDGRAILRHKGASVDAEVMTQTGSCRNYEAALDSWLAS